MNPYYRLRRALSRRCFTAAYRQRFYRMLAQQMKNGVTMAETPEHISNMYTGSGCRHALAKWVPAGEAALIRAGMVSGRLPDALARAAVLADCRRHLCNTVLRMAIYPLVMGVILSVMPVIIQAALCPPPSGGTAPQTWQAGPEAGMATLKEHR